MRSPPFRRVGTPLLQHELDRARAAAKIREMPVTEFMRQAVLIASDATLATRRFESDPYARRPVETYGVVPPRR